MPPLRRNCYARRMVRIPCLAISQLLVSGVVLPPPSSAAHFLHPDIPSSLQPPPGGVKAGLVGSLVPCGRKVSVVCKRPLGLRRPLSSTLISGRGQQHSVNSNLPTKPYGTRLPIAAIIGTVTRGGRSGKGTRKEAALATGRSSTRVPLAAAEGATPVIAQAPDTSARRQLWRDRSRIGAEGARGRHLLPNSQAKGQRGARRAAPHVIPGRLDHDPDSLAFPA